MPKTTKSEQSIKDEIVQAIREGKDHCHHHHSVSGGGIYGLGLIGAAVYYFQHMPTQGDYLFTIIKIIFWPAFLVYRLLEINFF